MTELVYNHLGQKVSLRLKTPERYKISRTVNHQLSSDRIIGIDTESIIRSSLLRFKYLQLFANEHTLLHDQEQSADEILEVLFSWLLTNYGQDFQYLSQLEERSKEQRRTRNNGKKSGRDGRRQNILPVVLCFFNLQYDLGRLIDENSLFRRIIGYGSDSFKFQYKRFRVEIVYSCIGVACPSFKWLIIDEQAKKAVSVIGFDGTSFFKSSLMEVTRQLKLTPKIDLEEDKDLFTRDWNLNPPSDEQLTRFAQYSLNDAKCHKEIYDILCLILSKIDVQIFDRQGVIPLSAPSAAARIMMHLCQEDEFLPPSVRSQQLGLNAYKGAISFCVSPGYCQGITVKDISSAYPHVMTLLPDFSTVKYRELPSMSGKKLAALIEEWSIRYKELDPIFGVVVADFQAYDSLYPIAVTYADGLQLGIYGSCYRTIITIPELIIAYNSGRCSISRIYEGIYLQGDNETSPLKKFVDLCYKIKTEEKVLNPLTGLKEETPLSLVAKLLMNSLYGKLIEKRHTSHIIRSFHQDQEGDNNYVLQVPDVREKPYKKAVLEVYLQEGEEAACEHANRIAYELYQGKYSDYILLSDLLSEESWTTGYYFNALYASQITGFTRAKLMCAASYTHALAGDTDSIFMSDDDAEKDLTEYLNSVGAITPEKGIGSFETELEHANGLILKKKQYYLETSKKLKIAHHAIQTVNGKEREEEAKQYLLLQGKSEEEIERSYGGIATKLQIKLYLQELFKEGTKTYTTRKKPVSLKDGIKFNKRLGEFIDKEITIIYKRMSEYQELIEGQLHWKRSTVYDNMRKED